MNGTFTLRAVPSAGFASSSTTNVTLTGGNTITADVGLRTTATTTGTVTGFVYADVNPQNGHRDAGENGVRGVTVFLDLDADGRLDSNEPTDVTDCTGAFTLTTTQTATFFVRAVLSPGYLRSSGFPSVTLPTPAGRRRRRTSACSPTCRRRPPRAAAGGRVHRRRASPRQGVRRGRAANWPTCAVFPGLNTRDVRVAVADVTGDGVDGPDRRDRARACRPRCVVLDGTNRPARCCPADAVRDGVHRRGVRRGRGPDRRRRSPTSSSPRTRAAGRGCGCSAGPDGLRRRSPTSSGSTTRTSAAAPGRRSATSTATASPDLVVAAGFGGGPRVAVFDGPTLRPGRAEQLFNDFFVFEHDAAERGVRRGRGRGRRRVRAT